MRDKNGNDLNQMSHWHVSSVLQNDLTPVRDYNNNRYGVEERARKQALPFIENKTAQTEPVHYRLNSNN